MLTPRRDFYKVSGALTRPPDPLALCFRRSFHLVLLILFKRYFFHYD